MCLTVENKVAGQDALVVIDHYIRLFQQRSLSSLGDWIIVGSLVRNVGLTLKIVASSKEAPICRMSMKSNFLC